MTWRNRELTFIEADKLADIGLRFVGFSDGVLRSIDHNGWFTSEFQDETFRGCVFQFPARHGRSFYIPGYFESVSGGYCVALGEGFRDDLPGGYDGGTGHGNTEARRDCARYGDTLAERHAETEREYQESWSLGQRFADLRDQAKAARFERRRLVASLRAARSEMARLRIDSAWSHDLCKVIRAKVAALKEQSREYYNEAESILTNNPYADKAAFNEGAGIEVL